MKTSKQTHSQGLKDSMFFVSTNESEEDLTHCFKMLLEKPLLYKPATITGIANIPCHIIQRKPCVLLNC